MSLRKLTKPTEEQMRADPLNILNEPAILEKMDGDRFVGASPIFKAAYTAIGDGDGGYKLVLGVFFDNKFIQYTIDSIEYDKVEGSIRFTSNEVQYKIRAIQKTDGPSWSMLQTYKKG